MSLDLRTFIIYLFRVYAWTIELDLGPMFLFLSLVYLSRFACEYDFFGSMIFILDLNFYS